MADADINVMGQKETRDAMLSLSQRITDAFGAALYEKGLAIMADAKKMCPVDTGALRASGYVAPPKVKGDRVIVELGFAKHYALKVHESVEMVMAGQPRENGRGHYWDSGEPKFLEKAIQAHSSDFDQFVSDRAWAHLQAGRGIRIQGGGNVEDSASSAEDAQG